MDDRNTPQKSTVRNVLCALSLIALALCVLPLLVIAHYNFPSVDDYSYGIPIRDAVADHLRFFGTLRVILENTVSTWHTWQGTYFDVFLYYANIFVCYPRFYFLVTYISLLLFVPSSLLAYSGIAGRFLHMPRTLSILAASVVTIFPLLFTVSAGEGFFWFSSSLAYTLGYAMMLLFLVLFGRLYSGAYRRSLGPIVLSFFLLFLLGGSNYGTGILLLELLNGMLILWLLRSKLPSFRKFVSPDKRFFPFLLSSTVFYDACFLLSALAPGNRVRRGGTESYGIAKSILLSYRESARLLRDWTHLPVIVLYLFLIALCLPYVLRRARDAALSGKRIFRLPGLYTAVTVSVYCSILSLSLYGTASYGPMRLLNLQYFLMAPMICSNVLYWVGYIANRLALRKPKDAEGKAGAGASFLSRVRSAACSGSDRYYLCVVLAFGILFGISLMKWGIFHTHVTSAIRSLYSGEAALYRLEQLERLEILGDETIRDAYLWEPTSRPSVFHGGDIVDDPENWINVSYARFFGKDSVHLIRRY